MSHAVQILRSAQRQLARIDRRGRDRLIEAIAALAETPRPPGCVKLTGRPAWRIRVQSYRVIYEIRDDELIVLVVAVGHRRDVYR